MPVRRRIHPRLRQAILRDALGRAAEKRVRAGIARAQAEYNHQYGASNAAIRKEATKDTAMAIQRGADAIVPGAGTLLGPAAQGIGSAVGDFATDLFGGPSMLNYQVDPRDWRLMGASRSVRRNKARYG